MIRVLVVEDTPVVREFLVHVLSSDPALHVIATAKDGEEALGAVERHRPDVITMDVHMPKLNGLEATRRIMETRPTPIVIVSGSSNASEVAWIFEAMEAGALAVAERPMGIGHSNHKVTAAALIQTVKLMSEVKVVRRWARRRTEAVLASVAPPPEVEVRPLPAEVKLIAIGASTGGPPALHQILAGLNATLAVPVLIVQHISPGFTEGFVEWLGQTSALPVQVATHGQRILAGNVYVAPDGYQMKAEKEARLSLTKDAPENGHRPSVSCLFRSAAETFGDEAIGVLLSGMGKDGAAELKLMRDQGAITIAQDKESSVVHGMPGEAILIGAATYVLAPDRIAAVLGSLLKPKRRVDP